MKDGWQGLRVVNDGEGWFLRVSNWWAYSHWWWLTMFIRWLIWLRMVDGQRLMVYRGKSRLTRGFVMLDDGLCQIWWLRYWTWWTSWDMDSRTQFSRVRRPLVSPWAPKVWNEKRREVQAAKCRLMLVNNATIRYNKRSSYCSGNQSSSEL